MTVEKSAALLSIMIGIGLFLTQVLYINDYAATWDQVDFVLALDRFDLLAMQPHFPGYPYFILGGTIVHLFTEQNAGALTLFNVVMYAAAFIPLYCLFRRFLTIERSILAGMLVYSASYPLIVVNQPMSEGAALACLWWYIWSIQKAIETNKRIVPFAPLFLFSILLGIRLSYILLGTGLLYLFFTKWRSGRYTIRSITGYTAAAILFQLIWIGALIMSEGSITAFFKLALAFTDGHFNKWGNTVMADSMPMWERTVTLIIENGLWTGIFIQSVIMALLYLVLSGFLLKKKVQFQSGLVRLLCILAASYSVWALFAQNIDKPRHILPAISISLFLFFTCVLIRKEMIVSMIAVILLIMQSITAVSLIKEQASSEPASYQLSSYLIDEGGEPVVYTWEEARVFQFLKVPVTYKEIQTYELFMQDQSYYDGHPIYMTGKVVEGFKEQGHDISDQLEQTAVFDSNPLFDPVYSRVVLYRWMR